MSSPKSPAKTPKSPTPEAAASRTAEQENAPIEPVGQIKVSQIALSDRLILVVCRLPTQTLRILTSVTDTESLRSSILNYKWENGRRYHAYGDGPYWAPNDDRQQEAEDLIHELFRIVLDGKLYEAPIGDNPQNILDVGCGTGIWAIDMADMHPSAEVVGVDLSPIQPNFIPPNCRFEVDDINKDWTFPENIFDFIHIRYMTGTVPSWPELLKTAQRHVKPGGWIEHVELWGDARADDDSMSPDSPLKTWVKIFEEVGKKIGNPFFWNPADAFKEAGLQNISERKVKVPIGT
ncbi:S-adenosyl-L-methionine-dependent methyltransferase [Fusarium acuminatum]|uniref:S-adenosyl-L-methionine-dependent methyltransferase n=1 Tax=Fusarium acuminatum TaxID=5515 RepID=A0ABZ2X1L2_9HYPO